MAVSDLMSIMRWLLLVALLSWACGGVPARQGGATSTWTARTGMSSVAFKGIPLRILLEERGGPSTAASAASIPVTARCTTCAPATTLRATAEVPTPAQQLAPGISKELVIVGLTFPEAGHWTIEPMNAVIDVRDPFITQDPYVELRSGSSVLPSGCDLPALAALLTRLGDAQRAARSGNLEALFAASVDFSDSGTTLPRFVAQDRASAANYLTERQRAGERMYPLAATAACCASPGIVDLAVTTMRTGADLGPGAHGGAYVTIAGSAVRCTDKTLLRWNSDLVKIDPV